MSVEYTLWTLNAARNLINQELANDNLGSDVFVFGDRGEYNAADSSNTEVPHNLMPDEEYFVPIAVKCLGSRFSDRYIESCKDKKIRDRLTGIRKHFYGIWSKDEKRKKLKGDGMLRSFWSMGSGPDGLSKMTTKGQQGYYDILKKNYDRTGRKNILAGYSLGGLVARYLAWLDEEVFGENIIAGIITVQSSNFGSPLANNDNAEYAVDHFLTILLSLVSMYRNYFPILNKYFNDRVDFRDVRDLLKSIRNDAKKLADEGNNNAVWLHEFIVTAIKWTSGLDKTSYDTAFRDLNIENLDEPFSVLSSVNEKSLSKIKYGAVVSSFSDFTGIIRSIINEMKNGRCIINIILNWLLKKKFFLGKTFGENFAEVSEIYRQIMTEKKMGLKNSTGNKIVSLYRTGLDKKDGPFSLDKRLPAYSHDFVIPSAYQLIEDNGKDNFLGVFLNERANHNSGKSLEFRAGRINSRLILKMLKNFKQ